MGETIHLAQLDQGQVLYVDKRNAQRPVEMFSQAGKVGPAYCTGVGKAMLAYLSDDELARALDRQSFHRFTEQTLDTPDKLLAELQAIRGPGLCLRPRGTRAGHHLRRRADPDPCRAGDGGACRSRQPRPAPRSTRWRG